MRKLSVVQIIILVLLVLAAVGVVAGLVLGLNGYNPVA